MSISSKYTTSRESLSASPTDQICNWRGGNNDVGLSLKLIKGNHNFSTEMVATKLKLKIVAYEPY